MPLSTTWFNRLTLTGGAETGPRLIHSQVVDECTLHGLLHEVRVQVGCRSCPLLAWTQIGPPPVRSRNDIKITCKLQYVNHLDELAPSRPAIVAGVCCLITFFVASIPTLGLYARR